MTARDHAVRSGVVTLGAPGLQGGSGVLLSRFRDVFPKAVAFVLMPALRSACRVVPPLAACAGRHLGLAPWAPRSGRATPGITGPPSRRWRAWRFAMASAGAEETPIGIPLWVPRPGAMFLMTRFVPPAFPQLLA
jgi:hypothetical protein